VSGRLDLGASATRERSRDREEWAAIEENVGQSWRPDLLESVGFGHVSEVIRAESPPD
jgi:hypothetical protein